jgi:hypothetical protein
MTTDDKPVRSIHAEKYMLKTWHADQHAQQLLIKAS